jgi:hypothetical protein
MITTCTIQAVTARSSPSGRPVHVRKRFRDVVRCLTIMLMIQTTPGNQSVELTSRLLGFDRAVGWQLPLTSQ